MFENSVAAPTDILVNTLCEACNPNSPLSFLILCIITALTLRFTIVFLFWIGKLILAGQSFLFGEKNLVDPTDVEIKEPSTLDRTLVIWLSFASTIVEGLILWACIVKLVICKAQNPDIINALATQSQEVKDLMQNPNYLKLFSLVSMCRIIPFQMIQFGSIFFYAADYCANRRSFKIAYTLQIMNFYHLAFTYISFIGIPMLFKIQSGALFYIITILATASLLRMNQKAFENHGVKKLYYRRMLAIFYFIPALCSIPFMDWSRANWIDIPIFIAFGADLILRLLIARYFKYLHDNNRNMG